MVQEAVEAKALSIIVVGAGEEEAEVRDLKVRPGVTVREALNQVGLEGYRLSRGQGTPFLDDAENLYGAVADGAKLYATTRADQGSIP